MVRNKKIDSKKLSDYAASGYVYHSHERRYKCALAFAQGSLVKQVADNIFSYIADISRS